jgi:uncharacterized protein YndB with AHSA1/START domain
MTTITEHEPMAKAAITTPSDREVRIERIFNAPRDRVWKAMTDPNLVAQWWGRGNKLVIERLEVERGGHWRFVEHSDHGVHGFEGRYAEVKPPERVVQTFEWDGMPGHVALETATLEDIAIPHYPGSRRHAAVGDGRRIEPELRGTGPCSGDDALGRIRRFDHDILLTSLCPFARALATCGELRISANGLGSGGSFTIGRSARSYHPTSCHAPNLYPTWWYTPTGANPARLCMPSLAGLGRVIPAYTFR